MKLAHVVPSLEERHGGPSKSVRALANAAAALGIPTELLATCEAGQTIGPATHDAAVRHIFPRERPRWVCPSAGLRTHLLQGDYGCIHSHGLWLRPLHYAHVAARRRKIPLVISPRGMLSGWAYAHRRWRKQLAEWFIHPGAFRDAAGWHATSAEEADDIRRLGFTQPICVAPNGVVLPAETELAAARAVWHGLCPALAGRRVAVFYSRFHRKKRVKELVESWLQRDRGDWFLLLVGVPEEYSPADINHWIATAGGEHRAAAFDGTSLPSPFGVAALSLLPTHSENFGLVVAEALAAGVPVLVTDTTPWRDLSRREAGWCVPWANWDEALATALVETPESLRRRGAAGQAWVAEQFTWTGAARRLSEFYAQLPDG